MIAPRSVARCLSSVIGLSVLLVALPFAGSAADPYVINVVLPLTGAAALIGSSSAKALTLYEEAINKTGGIFGRPLKFDIADDQTNPALSVQLVSRIIASQAPVMIGPELSASCSAVAPLLKDGPVAFCLSPGIHPDLGSYMFSAAPSTLDLAIITARYVKQRGWKKIAFIFSTDSSGVDGEHQIDQVFASPAGKDTTIVDVEHFGVTDLTVAAQLARIKASGAEALDVWATGTPSATVLRGIQDAGITIPITMRSYSPLAWISNRRSMAM